MKRKVFIIFLFVVLIVLLSSNLVWANDIEKGEYSKKYEEWLRLSDDEKEKVIAPLPINIRKSEENLPIKLFLKKLIRATANEIELPDKFDLREHIDIEVKNQMDTGECWAFAASSAVETYLALRDEDYSFSERHMDYATSCSFIERTYRRFPK